jgi:hypothetical protein
VQTDHEPQAKQLTHLSKPGRREEMPEVFTEEMAHRYGAIGTTTSSSTASRRVTPD